MVRVAAVQETGVYFDRDGCIARAVELIERAASDLVELLVFPEAWIPGYPDFIWAMPPSNGSGDVEDLYSQLFENSIDLSTDQLAPIQAAAREHHVVVVLGINERASEMSAGTLFNTAVTIDATGEILNVHRKVMPTNGERTVWGFGDGRGLQVVDTAVGPGRGAGVLGELHASGTDGHLQPERRDLLRPNRGSPRELACRDATHRP